MRTHAPLHGGGLCPSSMHSTVPASVRAAVPPPCPRSSTAVTRHSTHGGTLQSWRVQHAPLSLPSAPRQACVAAARGSGSGGAAVAEPAEPFAESIEDRELHVEASESYLAYAMSVIVGRALPDVRDGLKPVHRRILFAMHDLGLSHNKPYRKCARVVGEVLGKYHPHGDSAVYDALVRLAQDFSMRHPLIAGHGNFGSLDDDPPAAMRYTECRLQSLSSDMLLTNLDEDVVKFIPTFDGSQDEPTVLPASIPHLLVNGTNGIAVGIATRIPPHNLQEVVAGLSAYIANQDITDQELREFIPGPDFPTGGVIGVGQGLVDAYATGVGSVLLRAKVDLEGEDGGRSPASKPRGGKSRRSGATNIVISEVPYQTSKAELVAKIAELVEAKTLVGVADVRDESDREGLRVVVELRQGTSPDVVLAGLYKHTRLESRVSCNMVALVDGAPKQLSLRDFFKHFLAFRCDVLARRAQNQLRKARDRLHLVTGFLAAMGRLDYVVQLIREAADTAAARTALMNELQLTVTQADATLALPLRRLTSMERSSLEGELQQVNTSISDLEDFLASPARILARVDSDAKAVASKHGAPRRTQVIQEEEAYGKVAEAAAAAAAATAAASEVLLMASARRFVCRIPSDAFEAQNKGGKGKLGVALREGDCLSQVVRTTEGNQVLVVTSSGHAYSIPAAAIPPPSKSGYGSAIAQVLNTASSVPMVALVPLKPLPPGALPTKAKSRGSRKADTAAAPPSATAEATQPEAAPSATEVLEPLDAAESPAAVSTSASAGGEADEAPASTTADETYLLLLTHSGEIKKTPLTHNYYKTTKSGLNVMKVDPSRPLGWAASCGPNDTVLLASSSGRLLLFPASQLRPCGRSGGAVKGIKLQPGHKAVGMTVVPEKLAPSMSTQGAPEEEEVQSEEEEEAPSAQQQPSHEPCVLLVTAGGKGKRVRLGDLSMHNRGAMGALGTRLTSKGGAQDTLAAVALVMPQDEVLVASERGKIVRVQASSIDVLKTRHMSRVLMDLQEGDTVQTTAVIPARRSESEAV